MFTLEKGRSLTMNRKTKLLKSWTQITAYLTVLAAFVLFTGTLSAGYIYDGEDVPGHRLVRVVFGTSAPNPRHPDQNYRTSEFRKSQMRAAIIGLQPAISYQTHVEFWYSRDEGTRTTHTNLALLSAAAAQRNADRYANINNVAPIYVTFSLHKK